MSRIDEQRLHNGPDDEPERDRSSHGRVIEIGSRFGMSKEAARAEMDRFRGVAEYETRKILGQHSALKQPITQSAPEQDAPKRNSGTRTRIDPRGDWAVASVEPSPTGETKKAPAGQMELFCRAANE